jgi:hypothetical protein
VEVCVVEIEEGHVKLVRNRCHSLDELCQGILEALRRIGVICQLQRKPNSEQLKPHLRLKNSSAWTDFLVPP